MKIINKMGAVALFFILINGCSQCQKVTNDKPIYIYTYEKTPELKVDDTKKLIDQFLGEKDPKDMVKSDENIVYFYGKDDASQHVEQDLTTGNITFNKGMKAYMGDAVPQLPSPDEAQKIAETYLKANNFFPKNQGEFTLLHQGGLRATSVLDGNKAGKVIDKLITLNYGRVLDSLPVMGRGSKIVVKVGNKGEIVGMIRRWREFSAEPKKQVAVQEMITAEEANALAKRQIASEFGEKATFTINKSSKAYYDNNGTILQPVYAFETTVTLEGQNKNIQPINYLCIIEALKNSPEPLQLTRVEPRAKETIKNIQKGAIDTTGNRRRNKD